VSAQIKATIISIKSSRQKPWITIFAYRRHNAKNSTNCANYMQ